MADTEKKGGQTAPETDTKGKGTGGTPPAEKIETPGDNKSALRAKELELADTKAELAKLRSELGGVKSGSDGLRKVLAEAEAKAKDADAIAKKAVADAKKAEDAAKAIEAKAQDAIELAERKMADARNLQTAGVISSANRVREMIDATEPATERPAPRTETQPARRDINHQIMVLDRGMYGHRTGTDNCGDGAKCCCHPFTRTWFWATVAAVLLIAFGAGIWWFSGTTATTTSSTPSAVTTTTSPDPLAADAGQFLQSCLAAGGSPTDCANGFEAVTN